MNIDHLDRIIQRFSAKHLLVIGDLMLDEYIRGRVERISPEAPVQVVEVEREDFMVGGAGNVAKNIVSLKASVSVCGVVGNDSDGRRLIESLQAVGIDTNGVFVDKERPTTKKVRVIGPRNQQVVRIDWEEKRKIPEKIEERVLQRISSNLCAYDAVVISDYAKGVVTKRLVSEVAACCLEKKLPLVVDPKGHDYSRYRQATIITPNLRELSLEYGKPIKTEEEVIKAADYLIKKHALTSILVTRSAEGMTLVQREGKHLTIPARAREVFDVSGAGDTVAAIVGLCLSSNVPLPATAAIANMAAGIVVGKVGTATVSQEEISSYTQRLHFRKKITDQDSLQKLVSQKQSLGKRFVFTYGHFNMLKYEFIRFLQKARQNGDYLIIGINSDFSLKSLNHESPLSEDERAHIISSLDCVDYVVLFDEATPELLIRELSPDILIENSFKELAGGS